MHPKQFPLIGPFESRVVVNTGGAKSIVVSTTMGVRAPLFIAKTSYAEMVVEALNTAWTSRELVTLHPGPLESTNIKWRISDEYYTTYIHWLIEDNPMTCSHCGQSHIEGWQSTTNLEDSLCLNCVEIE